jgi:hypothetical protein
MKRDGELRRHARSIKSALVSVVWTDRLGGDKFVNGRTVDISEAGIRIEVSEPIDKQTYVTVQCSEVGLHGRASVRTCIRKGTKYLLGLEFSGGVHWRAKS